MLKIVLFQPEIPQNTGNIARTCAATETELHLIAPLGFHLDDRHLKRAGIDYWPFVKLFTHQGFDKFLEEKTKKGGRLIAFTTHTKTYYQQFDFLDGDWLIFGGEKNGFSSEITKYFDHAVKIPMKSNDIRSLNLATSAAIALFEAKRQLNQLGGL